MSNISLRLPAAAASAIEVEVMDPAHDEDKPYPAIRAAYRGGRLYHNDPTALRRLWDDVCELSNHQDDLSRETGVSPDERAFCARACKSLSTVLTHLSAVMRAAGQ